MNMAFRGLGYAQSWMDLRLCFRLGTVPHQCTLLKYRSYNDRYVKMK